MSLQVCLYLGNVAYGLLKVEYKHTMEFFCEKENLKKKNSEISILALS